MALIRWEPINELNTIQGEMNRLFNSFFDMPQGDRPAAPRRWIPPMDLVETSDEFVLHADLPGLSEDEVDITLQDNVLTISGQRTAHHEQKAEGYYRLERGSGSFSRSLTLPEGVDGSRVHAQFDRGVLEVHIPKPEERKPRKVSIGIGSSPHTIEADASSSAQTIGAGSSTSSANAGAPAGVS